MAGLVILRMNFYRRFAWNRQGGRTNPPPPLAKMARRRTRAGVNTRTGKGGGGADSALPSCF